MTPLTVMPDSEELTAQQRRRLPRVHSLFAFLNSDLLTHLTLTGLTFFFLIINIVDCFCFFKSIMLLIIP